MRFTTPRRPLREVLARAAAEPLRKAPPSLKCFAGGQHWQHLAQSTVAKGYYRRALGLDPENVGALANLGTALADEGEAARARRWLREALKVLEGDRGRIPFAYDANWYRVTYSIAATYANEAAPQSKPTPYDIAEAKRHANALARKVVKMRRHLETPLWRGPVQVARRSKTLTRSQRKALNAFLRESLEPSALILYAARLDQVKPHLSPVSHRQVVKELRQSKPSPEVLVAYISRLEERAPQVDYNLACLFTQWELWAKAADHLRDSILQTLRVQQPRQVDRALLDPTLKRLWPTKPGAKLHEWLERLRGEERPVVVSPKAHNEAALAEEAP